ncbi:hypothetical protein TCAL_14597 [Tigriopus californicus]|uniref:Uncharacterized protein n=1 Tax=Tigriopus californicus TaxID=6832 RepID=A0A553PD69_TIGCA|nr:hypothetical protein TCAL_14597 [Tigriopus californicus]
MTTTTLVILLQCLISAAQASPTIFQRSGNIATDVTSYVLLGQIDLEPIMAQQRNLTQLDSLLQEVWVATSEDDSTPEQRYLLTQLRLIHDQIQTTDHKLHDLISLMEISGQPQPPPFQGKRSALLMAGLVAIGSTLRNLVYSHYLSTRIDGIQRQEDYLTHGLDILTGKTADNTRQLQIQDKAVDVLLKQHLGIRQQINKDIHMHQWAATTTPVPRKTISTTDATYRSLATYTQTLAEILTTINSALQGKVDTYLISPAQVRQELQQIKQRFPDDMKIAIEANHIIDFLAFPCHAKITNTTFQVAVPIPIFNVKETLDLYKHIPTPLVVDQGLEIFLDSHTQMLATNTENTLYLDPEASDIQACLNVGTLYLFPALQVQLKDSQPSCLHLLFRGLTEQAMQHCQHQVRLTRSLELTLTESHSVLVTASELLDLMDSFRQTFIHFSAWQLLSTG